MTDSAASNGQSGNASGERIRSMGRKELWLKEDRWAICLANDVYLSARDWYDRFHAA